MEPVLDVVADSSPAPEAVSQPAVVQAPAQAEPSYMDRVNALPKNSKARTHYRMTQDLKAAEALIERNDGNSDSSPDAEGFTPGNEPEAAPGSEQQRNPDGAERSRKADYKNGIRLKESLGEIARLKAELEQARKPIAAAPASIKPAPVPVETLSAEPEPPDMNDFTDPKDYHEANKKFFRDLKTWNSQDAARTAAVEREQRTESETIERFRGDIGKAKTKYKDFDAVAFNPQNTMSDAMAHLFPRMKDGAELVYYLGKNPTEAKRIADLTHINGLDPERSVEHFAHLLKLNHPLAHQMLGMARAELSRIQISSSSAAPAAKPLREVIGSRPQSRPSSEVAVDANSGGAPIDQLGAAIKSGNSREYKRIITKRLLDAKKFG